MNPLDSSSTGSPFSYTSTNPSSPETNFGQNTDSYTQALQAKEALAQKNALASGGFSGMFRNGGGGIQGNQGRGFIGSGGGGVGGNMGNNGVMGGYPNYQDVQVKIEPGLSHNYQQMLPSLPQQTPSVTQRNFSTQSSPTSDQKGFHSTSATSSRATSVGLESGINGGTVQTVSGTGLAAIIPQPQSRSEPPKRLIEVDWLPLSTASVEEVKATPSRNRMLLQGDPQIINKQRVETAIRVILDLLRSIPPAPSTPPLPPALFNVLPPDSTLTFLSFERINCFKTLRLQAGTTTKAIAKKQLQAGKTPEPELAYLETAVYMSGESGRRVYVCKRCRLREARRRASKDASRKKQVSSGSDTSSSSPGLPSRTGVPPSQDYITGENPDQYDPARNDQFVEEPGWDPKRPDWRHEIVLFNSAPEVQIKDGACVWLPFRVVCYGKCHGEKVGFRIKFTLRSSDGAIIATSTTDPIRITDDHKTDKGVKPKTEGLSQPAVPRGRKGRASAASSRRQSPAPSEGESVQSISEAGAVLQKQTPNVRAKPYERPTSISPANQVGNLPYDFGMSFNDVQPPKFTRVPSSGSLPSAPQLPQTSADMMNTYQQSNRNAIPQNVGNTVSPGVLRRPIFPSMTPIDSSSSVFPSSAPHSQASSSVSSPSAAFRTLGGDDMLLPNSQISPQSLTAAFANLNAIGHQQNQQPQNLMLSTDYMVAQDMSTQLNSAMDGLFDTTSSAASLASSYNDEASGFSGFRDGASGLFSDSGVVPEQDNSMEGFLDFSGGDDQELAQPTFSSFSPSAGNIPPLFGDMDLSGNSPGVNGLSPQSPGRAESEAQLREILSSLAQNNQQEINIPPQPVVSHVIPAEGPMAGGIQVAVAGQRFTPGMTIMFGPRVAKTNVISDGFCTCDLPPSAEPGSVEVSVQGAIRTQGQKIETFKYQGMDREMMRLALEVRDQYQGSSQNAAYRLAQRIASGSQSNSESSDRSSLSPLNSGPSPGSFGYSATASDLADKAGEYDLQMTIINFLSTIDEHAPGSLRRSGVINLRNKAQQTILHIATVMGFHRLVRRLILIGAHLDLQDTNGFTPLSFASLCGQLTCARVLIEAGASYDRPTLFGEMPLDLAKAGEREDVEALLLSAVWSTSPGPAKAKLLEAIESDKEVDDDNPSSESELDDQYRVKPIKRRLSKKSRGKLPLLSPPITTIRTDLSKEINEDKDTTPQATPLQSPTIVSSPHDDPPPYEPQIRGSPSSSTTRVDQAGSGESWLMRRLSNVSRNSDLVWNKLPIPSLFDKSHISTPEDVIEEEEPTNSSGGWIALPAPNWEILSKLTSPEEVKLFTQAMAASALNSILQSTNLDVFGNVASFNQVSPPKRGRKEKKRTNSMNSQSASGSGGGLDDSRSRNRKEGRKSRRGSGDNVVDGVVAVSDKNKEAAIVKQTKQDRMLYMFWLPILLFVGFWLFVTALPIATGFCLIYGRQIMRAMRQKV